MRQHKAATPSNIQERMFDSLVRNAIDFLERSVHELEKEPKYSVIDFSAAVELFLKARLFKEHWSLIVSKIEKVTIQGFQNGDFQSVTIDECLQRLHSVASEALKEHGRRPKRSTTATGIITLRSSSLGRPAHLPSGPHKPPATTSYTRPTFQRTESRPSHSG